MDISSDEQSKFSKLINRLKMKNKEKIKSAKD